MIETLRRAYRIWRSGRCLDYLQQHAERTGDIELRKDTAVFVFAYGRWLKREYFDLFGHHADEDELYQDES